MNSRRQQELQISEMLATSIEALGFELVAAELRTVDGQYTLRISIDKPGGVGIQDCILASREISPLLDVEDPVDRAYNLQVSSPGMDRPLQRLTDFESFQNFHAKILLEEGPPRRRYRGVLRGVDQGLVLIERVVLWNVGRGGEHAVLVEQYVPLRNHVECSAQPSCGDCIGSWSRPLAT